MSKSPYSQNFQWVIETNYVTFLKYFTNSKYIMCFLCDEILESYLKEHGYQLKTCIGQGHYGRAYLVQSLHYHQDFVCKYIPLRKQVSKEEQEREIFALQTLTHPNIMSIYDSWEGEDHICFIPNPLIGPNIDAFGPRFPEMGNAYSSKLLQLAKDISQEYQLNIHEGCYVAVTGPSYETPAEVAFYRQIGGDAVGMSTAPEVIAARHAGMEVFALSVITNQAAQKNSVPPSHEEVMREGKKAENKVRYLLTEMIKRV